MDDAKTRAQEIQLDIWGQIFGVGVETPDACRRQDPIGLAGGLNLYGFAGGDPVNFSDPLGLLADTIQVQAVRTGLSEYHTSIRVAPDDGSPAFTLGAGPASKTLAVLQLPTTRVSDRDRGGDT